MRQVGYSRLRRRGQGMTEYIVMVGLVAILLIGAVSKFSNGLKATVQKSTDSLAAHVTDKIGRMPRSGSNGPATGPAVSNASLGGPDDATTPAPGPAGPPKKPGP